jgi:hypothetical protein
MLSSAAGIGSAFLGSFLTTRDGIKVGMSSMMIGNALWGTSLATGLSLGLSVPTQYVYALAIAGSGIGMGAGYVIARKYDTKPGDAAILNTASLFGTGAGVLLAQAIFRNPSAQTFGWFMLGGTSVGLFTGGLLAWKLDLSRGRVAFIDVGGLAGTGLGFALGYVIGVNSGGEDSIQVASRYAIGGMVLGLLAGALITRRYKGDSPPPVEALLRRHNGRFAFGLPSINIEHALTPEGSAPRITLTLAKGTF